MHRIYLLFLFFSIIGLFNCKLPAKEHPELVAIRIQPFADIPEEEVQYIYTALKKIYPLVTLSNKIAFPDRAMNQLGYRYRADSLLQYLNTIVHQHEIIIALTGRDISTTKGDIADWGVMGLGFAPGKVCVASSFRLVQQKRMAQFVKVAEHELGHTEGLQHCPVKTCIMRDAEGGNTLDEEKDFCVSCRNHLIARFWKL
ncbi:archaemetzincin family Zn-dependent metalloprotease [soil metagenome]|jgi:archaemetzincin